MAPKPDRERVTLGVSACLLGQRVRYDGNHKLNAFVSRELAEAFDLEPFCPEAGAGLGVPRPPVRLVGEPQRPRAIGVEDPNLDVTQQLETYADTLIPGLSHLDGCILKRNSPSCGINGVKLHPAPDQPAEHNGSGIFALRMQQHYPELPLVDEEVLENPSAAEHFIQRVMIHRHWRSMLESGLSHAALIDFHHRERLLILAYSEPATLALDQLITQPSGGDPESLSQQYLRQLTRACKDPISHEAHLRVSQLLCSRLNNHMDSGQKAAITRLMQAYRLGICSLDELLDTFARCAGGSDRSDLAHASYLNPHPLIRSLRQQSSDSAQPAE